MELNRRDMILGALGGALFPSVARADVQVSGGLAFGSTWRIVAGREIDLGAIKPQIAAVIAQVDRQMSPYRSGSDLSRFNTSDARDWQPMPPAMCHVASEALRIAQLTEGAFDPTVGPVVARFGFGPIKGGSGPFAGIEARATALRKSAPDLTLDLCGIAKGYALDRIVAVLAEAGVANALVEVGGEVRSLGHHPSGRAWRVAVADPLMSAFKARRIVSLDGYALATSGHAANGVTGSITTSHIISPYHDAPASTALASVSVLAKTATEADALATALCAAGPRAGVALARRLRVSALFIRTRVDGLEEVTTGRFAHHFLI